MFSDYALIFVFLPNEFSRMELGRLWCFFHFLTFFCLGFTSQIVYYGGAIAYLAESLKVPFEFRTFFSGGLAVAFFCIGLCMTTRGGIYVLTIMDEYAASWNCLVTILFMLTAFTIYGELIKICFLPLSYMYFYVHFLLIQMYLF